MTEGAFSATLLSLARLEMSEWWPLALGLALLILGLIAAYAGWGRPRDSG